MICSSVVREKTSKFSRLSPEGWAVEYRAEAPSGWGVSAFFVSDPACPRAGRFAVCSEPSRDFGSKG
jgi:hypothetical protein